MADLSIFKLNSQTITIKDSTAREAADSAKALATTASGNATTALNKINELESEKADAIISSTSGAIASFPDGAESTAKKLVVGIEPVQEGIGDPSPDNVRLITGWTGAKVTRTGKNLYAGTKSKLEHIIYGGRDNDTVRYDEDWSLKPGTYTLSLGFSEMTEHPSMFVSYLLNGTWHNTNEGKVDSFSFTLPEGYTQLNIWAYAGTFTRIVNIQIELGSTATDYEPYQGETYSITFPSEAGTVYGGSLDVTTGVLTVDRAQIASYNGETLPGKWISDRDVYAAGASPTTGAQVVYELATPQTYQLTPQEVRTLLGQNNIWANTGDTSVAYRADTKLYIDKKFTELQALILEN